MLQTMFILINELNTLSSARCLKAGMKPELVDAAFRRKSNHRRLTAAAAFDEPVLFDNFKSLEKDDLLDFFQVNKVAPM